MSDIAIRHAELRDLDALRQINAQPGVYHNTLQVPHPSLEMWEERMKRSSPGRKHLVACIDDVVAGNLVVDVEVNPRRGHVASFGISVSVHFRNRGVASALLAAMVDLCDNWLRIERIELTVFTDNEPAIAVYRKFGFEIEGTGKNYALRNGQFVDAYFMARFKPV
jgi:putative acetyltransferase